MTDNQSLTAAAQQHPLRGRAKDTERARARELRAGGATYSEIAAELGVSKGSISLWVREIPRAGRISTAETARRQAEQLSRNRDVLRRRRESRWQAIRRQSQAEIGDLSDREVLIAGAIAYWCEGSKSKPHRRSEQLAFVNSDPDLIRFFLRFMAVAGVARERLYCRLLIHESADIAGALAFWQDVTGLPADQFRPPTLKRHNPSTVRKNVGETYRGCLVVRVIRSSELYRQTEAWAQAIMRSEFEGAQLSVPFRSRII